MKLFLLPLLSFVVSGTHAEKFLNKLPPGAIKVDSDLGRELLSQARNLASASGNNAGDDIWATTDAWVGNFSLSYQGCFQISQWNTNFDGADDVRVATKRLVRFRLCPSDTCSTGCNTGYGEYIIDLHTYLYYMFQAKATYQEYNCDYLKTYVCGCNGDSTCLYQCYSDHNMASVCYGSSASSGNASSLTIENYMKCTKSSFYDTHNNYLYIGPFCENQGGAIMLGVFTDDVCTNFADAYYGASTYKNATGTDLPYSKTSIVDMECMSCREPSTKNTDGNDATDVDTVAEVCEAIYANAGKCETGLPANTTQYPNTNGCNYIAGVKIARKDGSIQSADSRANKTAGVFIGLFTIMSIVLGTYSYYLKTRLDRASINLGDDE
jgi:hypothetical protein